MTSKTNTSVAVRAGGPLQVGREWVPYGRNVVAKTGSTYTLQHRFFVNNPWAVIAEIALHLIAAPRGVRIQSRIRSVLATLVSVSDGPWPQLKSEPRPRYRCRHSVTFLS